MSLDVWLKVRSNHEHIVAPARQAIFIRENGETKEISREEWDRRHPGVEPVQENCDDCQPMQEVFSANVTHNLAQMADAAGIYKCLWCPDEIGITRASQLIEPLTTGLALLRSDPDRFKRHNPDDGWGSYDGFVPWVQRYLEACREYPEAEISAWG